MNKSILLAISISVALIIWLLTGVLDETTPEQTSTQPVAQNVASLMLVQTVTSLSQSTSKKILLQGQVEPFRVLSLRAEVDGRVESLVAQLGERVDKNALLIRQALTFRVAQRKEAQAQIKYRKSLLEGSEKLLNKGLASTSKVAQDEALLATAQAQLERIEYEISNVNIVAPFAGVMNQRLVEVGDYVEKGQTVATLVDDAKLKIAAMVPQHQLAALQLGKTVSAKLINGDVATGMLTFISTTAEEATRSYRVEVLVENPEYHRWVGMSATLSIPVSQVEGHKVATSVVGLSTQGQLQVKVLDEQSLVKAYPIEIIATETDGLWISGLPHKIELITLGQDFVSAGQQVIGQNRQAKL
jgi:multidrug efflux system membrane fusion protein